MTNFEMNCNANNQRFGITLNGIQYRLQIVWRTFSQCWVMSILNLDGTPVISEIPLVAGANLLEQYQHLGFGGELYAFNVDNPEIPPSFSSLGSEGKLFWVAE